MTFMTFSYGNLYVCIEEFRIQVYTVSMLSYSNIYGDSVVSSPRKAKGRAKRLGIVLMEIYCRQNDYHTYNFIIIPIIYLKVKETNFVFHQISLKHIN